MNKIISPRKVYNPDDSKEFPIPANLQIASAKNEWVILSYYLDDKGIPTIDIEKVKK